MASRNEAESPRCFKNMDDLSRCPICFDFLNIAMMTKCSHNFCSLCIRKYLAIKLHCPVCNSQITEQDLTNNRTLDEMIVEFQTVRRQWPKASRDTPPETPPTAVVCRMSNTPKKDGSVCRMSNTPKKDGSILSHFAQKVPKRHYTTLHATTNAQQASLAAPRVPQGNETTHSQITSNGDLHERSAPPTLTAEQPMESWVVRAPKKRKSVKLENVDMDYPISPPPPSNENVNMDNTISAPPPSNEKVDMDDTISFSPPSDAPETFSPTEDKKPGIKVECPVCSICIASNFINRHLDMCLASGPKKNSLRSSGGARMRPLGKLVYNLLSLQQLKRKLKECHLSVDGSREQLERKHKEFVHMYNAQCDSLTPKSAQDISKEVEANEKTRSQLQRKAKPVMVFSKNQPEEEIDTMHSNYRKKHSSEFSRLVTQVRSRKERCSQVKQEDREEGEEVSDQSHAQTAVHSAELKDCMTSDETGGDVTSDASVSSSLPDVFEPEPLRKIDSEGSGSSFKELDMIEPVMKGPVVEEEEEGGERGTEEADGTPAAATTEDKVIEPLVESSAERVKPLAGEEEEEEEEKKNMKTRKRASSSREEDAADPLVPLKRKCKTLREDR